MKKLGTVTTGFLLLSGGVLLSGCGTRIRALTEFAALLSPDLYAGRAIRCAGPTRSTFVDSGPITAVSGQVITGLRITNPAGPCITVLNVSNVTIHDNFIGPCGSTAQGNGIETENSSNVTIFNNHIEDVATGLYATDTAAGGIVFECNFVTKTRGPYPRGQMAQYNNVNGAGSRIRCNVSEQAVGGYPGGPEDHISIYMSGGTALSPLNIQHNKLRGGGTSLSGGGILLGDNGGDYVTAQDNILVEPGQYGIAIASGTNQKMLRNKIYAPVRAWNNNGLYVWNQYPNPCSANEVSDNRVLYYNSGGALNAGWDGGGCGVIAGWGTNNFSDLTLTEDIWNEDFSVCD